MYIISIIEIIKKVNSVWGEGAVTILHAGAEAAYGGPGLADDA